MIKNINIISELKKTKYKSIYLVEKKKINYILEEIEIKNKNFLEEIISEIKKIENLKIKTFLNIIDFFEDNNKFYILKEIIKNSKSLKSIIADGNLDYAQIKKISFSLCNIAGYLHKNDIMFINFNPENIFFDETNDIFLDNFGLLEIRLAKLAGFLNIKDAFEEIEYFAPNAVEERFDLSDDYFSIGILTARLATGLPSKKFSSKKIPINLKKFKVNDVNLIQFVLKTTSYFPENRVNTLSDCKSYLLENIETHFQYGVSPKKILLYALIILFAFVFLFTSYLYFGRHYSYEEIVDNYKAFWGFSSKSLMKRLQQQIAVKVRKEILAEQEKMKKYLFVDSIPDKAIVSINDEPIGLTPVMLGIMKTNVNFRLKLEKVGFDIWERTIRLKETKTNRIKIRLNKNLFLSEIEAHSDELTSLSLNYNSKYLTSAAKDGNVIVWTTDKWERVTSLQKIKYKPYSVAFSPTKEILIVGSGYGEMIFLDTENWFKVDTIKAHNSPVYSITFSPDGKYVVTGGVDNYIKMWDPKSGDLVKEIENAHKDVIKSIAFSYDGRFFASGSWDKTVKVWRTGVWEKVKEFKEESPVWSINFGFNNQLAVAMERFGDKNNSVKIYNIVTFKEVSQLNTNDENATSLAFSPDGKFLAVASENIIYVFNTTTMKIVTKLVQHTEYIKALGFSNDGKFLISGDESGKIAVWDGIGLNLFQ